MSKLSYALAIFLGLLAYSVLNIGLVLEKKGADSLPLIENTSALQNVKNFFGSRVWLVGFILTNVQWFIYFAAVALAPLILIAPLMGFGLIVLAIFSRYYLKESIARVEIMSMGAIIGGIVLIGATAIEESPRTIEQMWGLFGQPFALIYLLGIGVAAGILCIYSARSNFKLGAIIFGFAAGVGAGVGATFTKGASPGFSDIIGAAGNIIWWVMILLMLLGNVLSLILLQVGFQKGKAVIVGPLFAVLGMILPVFAGVIIFGEWGEQDLLNIAVQIIGLIVIIIGITILSFYSEKKKQKSPENG